MKIIEYIEQKKSKTNAIKKVYLNKENNAFSDMVSNTFFEEVYCIEFEMNFKLGRLSQSAFNGRVNSNLYIIDTETEREYRLTMKEIPKIFELINNCFENNLPLVGTFKTSSNGTISLIK